MATKLTLEDKIKKEIDKLCANKSSKITPKKWALIDNKEVELVYWMWYYEDKKVERLMDKIIDTINKKFGIEVTACADTTENLNWHYV